MKQFKIVLIYKIVKKNCEENIKENYVIIIKNDILTKYSLFEIYLLQKMLH